MTTLVAIRQPLEVVSMSNKPERRTGKRLAAAADYEQDEDFTFVRKTKKPKTTEDEPTTKPARSTKESSTGAPSSRNYIEESPPPFQVKKRGQEKPKRDNGLIARPRSPRDTSPEFNPGTKIALPMSDTPIINRNKEMRKQGGSSNRRSSYGSRGRRASTLIESGQAAIPHADVGPEHFYKHISTDAGLPEPRRMKQLLTWCGERALPARARRDTANASVLLAAEAIQKGLLQDFGSRSDLSDWLSRDENASRPRVLKPNPKNLELDKKMAALQGRIKRLQQEKEAWESMHKPIPEVPSLFEKDLDTITLPDFDLLDPDETTTRSYLLSELEPIEGVRARTESRIRSIQQSLEFEVDQFADNMHKFEQRVLAAGKEADKVLALSATRLKTREDKDKKNSGTKEMPMMEILRGLGRVLPEGGG